MTVETKDSRLEVFASGDLNFGMITAVFTDVSKGRITFADAIDSILKGFDSRATYCDQKASGSQDDIEKTHWRDHADLNKGWAQDLRQGKDVRYAYNEVDGVTIPATADEKKLTEEFLLQLPQ